MPRGKNPGALFFLILPHERPSEQGGGIVGFAAVRRSSSGVTTCSVTFSRIASLMLCLSSSLNTLPCSTVSSPFLTSSVSDRKKREYRLTLNAQSYMMVPDG